MVTEVCPLWMGLFHSCLPQAPVDVPPAPLSSCKMLFMWFYPPFPDPCLTCMVWFLTPLNLTLEQNHLPGLGSWPLTFLFIPFTCEPPAPVWCWAGNAEGLVLLWVLRDVDIAFHQLFCKQALSEMEQTPVRCRCLGQSPSGTNLCAGDTSAAIPKSSDGSATLPGALEMKGWALAPGHWLISSHWENQGLLSMSGGISGALVNDLHSNFLHSNIHSLHSNI